MHRSSHPPVRLVAVVALLMALGGLAPAARAQSIWLDRTEPKAVHLEIAKPLFGGAPGVGFFTVAGFFSTRLPLGERLSFVGELPLATFSFDSPSLFVDDETSTTIGNPYLGIQTRAGGETGGWLEFGVRVPLASDDESATISGGAADIDRWEAFLPNTFVVRAAGHWRDDPRRDGVGADFRVAPTLWISDDFADDVELFSTYGVQVLFHNEEARAGFGLTGRWLLTDDSAVALNSTHQFEAAIDFLRGDVRPGMTLRIPLDDDGFFGSSVDAVFGLTLNFVLP